MSRASSSENDFDKFGVPVEVFGIAMVQILEEICVCMFVVDAVHSVRSAMYVSRPELHEYLPEST